MLRSTPNNEIKIKSFLNHKQFTMSIHGFQIIDNTLQHDISLHFVKRHLSLLKREKEMFKLSLLILKQRDINSL